MQAYVTKTTRAGSRGKLIECPHCNSELRVFHFSWQGLVCQNCKAAVPKYEWLVVDKSIQKITVTLDKETWLGLLYHLRDTVTHIPVSAAYPDPWECVTNVIDALNDKLSDNDSQQHRV